MDIVLEVFDTFVLDGVYAAVYPARGAPFDYPHAGHNHSQTFSAWHYKPATYMFSLEPSQAAYMSAWPRDNIYRQAISLYLISWCVLPQEGNPPGRECGR